MGGNKLLAIALIVAGVVGLAYGSFSYTTESHDAKLGPIEFSVKEKETVNVRPEARSSPTAPTSSPFRDVTERPFPELRRWSRSCSSYPPLRSLPPFE